MAESKAKKLALALTRLLMSVPIGYMCGVQRVWPNVYPCVMSINGQERMLRDAWNALIRKFYFDDSGSTDTLIFYHSENRVLDTG